MISPSTPNAAPATDPLAALKPLHDPAAISWWPLAPGWWILGLLVLGILATLIWYGLNAYQQRRYRREALAMLLPDMTYSQLNQLLKQVAVHAFGKRSCAALHGQAWVAFLQQSCRRLSPDTLTTLSSAPYNHQAEEPVNTDDLHAAQCWIKHHHRPVTTPPTAIASTSSSTSVTGAAHADA